MGNKIIFKLKLNATDSIIAYEKRNYNTCYEDSRLYLCVGGQKIKFVEGSFCDGFGLEMYYRVFNIKEFDKPSSFGDEVKEYHNGLTFNDDYDPNDPDSPAYFTPTDFDDYDYSFAYGNPVDNVDPSLYLYKNKNGYTLIFLQLWETAPQNYEVKVLNEFFIDVATFAEWKTLICTEWEKRTRIEAERGGREPNEEELQDFFVYMRTDTRKK